MRYYCDDGKQHNEPYVALTPTDWVLYGTGVKGWQQSLGQAAAGSEQAWSEPAQALVLHTTLCAADTSAESFQNAADIFSLHGFSSLKRATVGES